jgi:hypothetical protein
MSHWYTREGEPFHKVSKPGGGERDTTLADAKRFATAKTRFLVPSVTSITAIMANNGLDFYKKQAVAKAAYACPVSSFETEDEYISHVIKKADEPMQLAQDFGTLIHARLDSILGGNGSVAEGEMVMLPEGREVPLASIIDPALDVIHELNLEFRSTERILTSRLGYAGTSDVLAMKNGMPVIVDYKTKKTTEGEPIVPYPEQKMQIAAYWHAAFPVWLDSPMGGCNIFISSTEPGRVEAHWYESEELEHAWETFKACLALWKQSKKYESGW